jgi:hypothetical protein
VEVGNIGGVGDCFVNPGMFLVVLGNEGKSSGDG